MKLRSPSRLEFFGLIEALLARTGPDSMMNHALNLVKCVLFYYFMILALPIGIWADAAKPSASLDIHIAIVRASQESHPAMAFVTLYNSDQLRPVTNIAVQVGDDKSLRNVKKLDSLQAGQSLITRIDVPIEASNPYIIISYDSDGKTYSLARTIKFPGLSKAAKVLSGIITPVLSLIGVVVGAFLVSFFTSRRERFRATLEWSWMLFEKYENSYRNFLNGWGGSTSAILLKTQFDILCANSLVPSSIVDAYRSTYSVLIDADAPDAQKQEACRSLRQEMDRFILQPWNAFVVKKEQIRHCPDVRE